jgi:hypothetical protein
MKRDGTAIAENIYQLTYQLGTCGKSAARPGCRPLKSGSSTAGITLIHIQTPFMKTNPTQPARKSFPPLGHKRWVIPDGFIPVDTQGSDTAGPGHETACILNVSDKDAQLQIWIFYSGGDPVGPYEVSVPARRTKHIGFNDLNEPAPILRGTDYASVIESDVPVIVQHMRLDSRRAENALVTTMAFADTESVM